MATIVYINDFVEGVHEKLHNLAADTIRIALSNTAPASEASNPTVSGNGILANVTQVAYTNYADTLTVDRVLEGVTSDETGGAYKLDFNDFTISAAGGALAPWRYIYVYNDTAAGDLLIACIDNGAAVSLAASESIQVIWAAAGFVTNAPV